MFTFVTQPSLTLAPPPLLLPVPPHQLLLRRLHLAAPPERNPRPEHQRGGEREERLPGACRLAQHHADGRDEEARQRRADVPCAARDNRQQSAAASDDQRLNLATLQSPLLQLFNQIVSGGVGLGPTPEMRAVCWPPIS